MKTIRKYLKLFPSADDLLIKKFELGNMYRLVGENVEAIKYLRSILPYADAKLEVETQFEIGECFFYGLRMYDKALAEYLKIRLYTDTIEYRYRVTTTERIAQCYEYRREWDEALRYYKEIARKTSK